MKIAVFGAGSTGCFLGAKLALAGFETYLICRPHVQQQITQNAGIRITDYRGLDHKVMPAGLITKLSQAHYGQFDVVFVTLKCHQIDSAINDILLLPKKSLPKKSQREATGATSKTVSGQVIFMQNGLGSLEPFTSQLQSVNWFQGITPFNVLQQKNAHFHKGTQGDFMFADTPLTREIQKALNESGDECELHQDMQPVIFGKLLLNLNNALNAIADVPIKQQLEQKPLRRLLAKAMQEWISVSKAMGIALAQFTRVKPTLVPKVLALPDWLFKQLASQMLDIDPLARSSMWEDIQASRKTEIEYLNGAVVRLGRQYQVATPVNKAIETAIIALEKGEPVSLDGFIAQLK